MSTESQFCAAHPNLAVSSKGRSVGQGRRGRDACAVWIRWRVERSSRQEAVRWRVIPPHPLGSVLILAGAVIGPKWPNARRSPPPDASAIGQGTDAAVGHFRPTPKVRGPFARLVRRAALQTGRFPAATLLLQGKMPRVTVPSNMRTDPRLDAPHGYRLEVLPRCGSVPRASSRAFSASHCCGGV